MYQKSSSSVNVGDQNHKNKRLWHKCQQHQQQENFPESLTSSAVSPTDGVDFMTRGTVPTSQQVICNVNIASLDSSGPPSDAMEQRLLAATTSSSAPLHSYAMPMTIDGATPFISTSATGIVRSSMVPATLTSSIACANVSASAAAYGFAPPSQSAKASASRTFRDNAKSVPLGIIDAAVGVGQVDIFPFGKPQSTADADARVRTAPIVARGTVPATTTPDQLVPTKKTIMENKTTKKAATTMMDSAVAVTVRNRRQLTQMQQPHTVAKRRSQLVVAIATAATATPTTSLSTAKSNCEKAEIKCPLKATSNVSNLRKVEAKATPPQHRRTLNSGINSVNNNHKDNTGESISFGNRSSRSTISKKRLPVQYKPRAECERPYGSSTITATSKSENADNNKSVQDTPSTLNLAARKAKLKAEFFKDFKRHVRVQHPQQEKLVTASQAPSIHATPSRAIRALPTTVLNPIPAQISASTTAASTSLVARRKLDLKRKLEQNLTSKSRSHGTGSSFPRVVQLVQKFETQPAKKMIVNPNKRGEATDDAANMLCTLKVADSLEQRSSPLSDEGCTLGQSPYSSDNEDSESIRTTSTTIELSKQKEKVARSASSDSALGLDVEESMDTAPDQPPTAPQPRRMTLTVTDLPLRPALLPLAEPTALPDSPTLDVPQSTQNSATAVPSKVILEERVVELPEDPRTLLGCSSLASSRRESAQSCGSDCGPAELPGARRFVRTPSVVVSDYSDDVMCGITLEEIEYFRAQRMRRRHSSLDTANEGDGESDLSAASSCSNLYYCGSTISALDGAECYVNGVRTELDRKTSDCPTCSVGVEEENFTIPEDTADTQQLGKDLADLLAAQHLSTKQAKKVGLVVPMCDNLSDKAQY